MTIHPADLLEDWHELMNDKAWRRLVVTVEDAIDEALERGLPRGARRRRSGDRAVTACICRPRDPEGWYREDCQVHGREVEEARSRE